VAAALLAQLADDSVHQHLTPADVWAVLTVEGIRPRNLSKDVGILAPVEALTATYLARLRRSYIGGHALEVDLRPRQLTDMVLSVSRGGRTLRFDDPLIGTLQPEDELVVVRAHA
jgi:hypothetical protein